MQRLTGQMGIAFLAAPTGDATALVTDILAPKTAYIATGKVTGTCTYDADTSSGDAVPADLALNKKAWVDGAEVTGTCTYDADTSSGDAVPADLALNKKAWVDGAEVVGSSTKNADTTDATATAADIFIGKTAYVADGSRQTGGLSIKKPYYYDLRLYAWPILVFNSDYGINYCVDGGGTPDGVFQGNTNVVDVTFILPSTANYFRNAFSECANLEEVTIGPTSSIVNNGVFGGWNGGFNECAKLHTIHSALNLSGATSYARLFTGCAALSNITFDANSIIGSVSFNDSPLLSSASLVSIANGLDASVAPKTLTMHATSKTNMDNITVDVVDGVAVLGSAMTLTAFITGVKGWTIA